jgi:pimeloyl-ACP methyl ester carboxylesterase
MVSQLTKRSDAARNIERIVKSAIHVLASDPAAGMNEVAAHAGVGRATVYRHFPTRDDLLAAIRARARQEAVAAVESCPLDEGSAVDCIEGIMRALIRLGERYRFIDGWRADGDEASERIAAAVRTAVERGQGRGEITRSVPVEWAVSAIRSVLLAAIEELGDGRLRVPVAALIPPYLMGSGMELVADYVDQDIMTNDEAAVRELGLDRLRVGDLVAVLDYFELERAALAGSSMGATTAMAFALERPERVPALVQITPAYTGQARTGDLDDDSWQRMADALERGGVEAFVEVALPDGVPERWREAAGQATRQRMERHEHPKAVAQALREVPRSIAWQGLEPLEDLDVPVLIVGSRDEADGLHPLAVAEEYERRLPRAELVVEGEGKSPLAWQGARLSGAIGDFLGRVGYS